MAGARLVTQVKTAIDAHLLWKGRLRQAILSPGNGLTPAVASRDDACALGRWLLSADIPDDEKNAAEYQAVRLAHAMFHHAAGQVLETARGGDREAAFRLMGDAFIQLSEELVRLLGAWEAALRSKSFALDPA